MKGFLLKGLGVVAALMVAGVVKMGVSEGFSAYQRATVDYGTKFDQIVLADANQRSFFVRMKVNFPTDYAKLRGDIVAKLRGGASGEEVQRSAFMAMRDFSRANRGLVAKAPSANLAAFRDTQLRTAQALRDESYGYCARFIMAGLSPDDQPGLDAQRELNLQLAAQLDAMAAGRNQPVDRSSAVLSDGEIATWAKAMKNVGMTDQQLSILDQDRLSSAPENEQCAIGILMLTAAAELPESQADRITVFLVNNS